VRSRSRNQSNRGDEENPYWISFSDLMSGLLVVFILAVVTLIIELTEKNQEIQQGIDELKLAQEARSQILLEVREELAAQNIVVEIADNETVLRIPEETLSFKSAKASLPTGSTVSEAVRGIGTAVHTAIMKNQRYQYLDTVFIEGHSDSQGIGYHGRGNWGLSTDRAISLWKYWRTEVNVEPKLPSIENTFGQKLFSVSGYGSTRLLVENDDTDEKRRLNRRIDIRFTVKKPEISDLESIQAR
jgi:flagellar motor protein MotB